MQNRYRKNCNPDCLFKSFVGGAIMKRESNAPEITRRGFLTLGAVGAVALVTPHGAFALDGVPAGGVSGDLSNIVVEPIENGWRVRDTSTGEVGTVVFLGNGRDSVATMPGGEIIVTRWNNDGTVTQNGVVIGEPEPHISPMSVPAGFTYLSTVHYDFSGLSEAALVLAIVGAGLSLIDATRIAAAAVDGLGALAGYASDFTMDLYQYVNWNTNQCFNVYKCYKNGKLDSTTEVGPFNLYH